MANLEAPSEPNPFRGRTTKMPLLRRESDHFPPGIFELSETCMPVWVAHVRSRQEKVFARHLHRAAVPFFLPLEEKRVRRRGRQLVSHLPLFAGYVFCRGGGEERLAALRTNLVCQILDVSDQRTLLDELAQLKSFQESGASLTPLPVFEPGDPVRVNAGAFQGYTGVVVRSGERQRLVVSISMLRKSVAVEFEREMVTAVPRGVVSSPSLPRAVIA
jgi:transcription antitermination factor NusG